MKVDQRYSKLERTIYTFEWGDIQRALLDSEKIPTAYNAGKQYEWEMDEDLKTVRLTIIHETGEVQP